MTNTKSFTKKKALLIVFAAAAIVLLFILLKNNADTKPDLRTTEGRQMFLQDLG